MASRVNTKFVVILLVVLVAVFAVVGGVGIFLFHRSAADLMKAGDKKMALGEFKAAADLYAKGVNKETTNVEYLHRWRTALASYVPETRIAFEEAYRKYLTAGRFEATLLKHDTKAHREYLELIFANETTFGGGSRAGLDALLSQVEQAIKLYEGSPKQAETDQLRRYRGIALVRILALTAEIRQEQIDQARADLETALRVDPADSQALESLVSLHELVAARATKNGQSDEALAAQQSGSAAAAAFVAANPGNGRGLLVKTILEMKAEERGLDASTMTREQWNALKDRRTRLIPRLDEIAALMTGPGTAADDASTLPQFKALENLIDPESKLARTESVIRKMLDARPTNVDLLMQCASILGEQRDYPGAISHLKKVLDLPKAPVGLEGFKAINSKQEAQYLLTLFAIRKWDSEKEGDAKKQALAEAKSFRDELQKTMDTANPAIAFINGQIAFADGDVATAEQLLRTYNTARKEEDVEGLWLAAQVAMRIQPARTGEARRLMERIRQMQPNNTQAMLFQAELETQLQNVNDAIQLYEIVHELEPKNAAVAERIQTLRAISGGSGSQSSDPVINRILEIKAAVDKGGSAEAMLAALRKAIADLGNDPRLVQTLASQLIQAGDKPGAIEVVRKALAERPDDVGLKSMDASLSATSEMEGEVRVAEISSATDAERAVRKYNIYRKYGKRAESLAALAEAARLAPEDPSVMELEFVEALNAKEFDRASGLREKLTAVDADKLRGETFRARLEAARGDLKTAIATMQGVVARGTSSPEAHRLLGWMFQQAGRPADALIAFEKALELRPNDVSAINETIGMMLQLGQSEAALARARESVRYASADPTFVSLLLSLEGSIGDKVGALDKRLKMLKARPGDRSNAMSAAALQIELKQWDDAKRTIDGLRSQKDDLDSVSLAARWYDAQGNRERAKAVFTDHIKGLKPEEVTAKPYIQLGRYLASFDDTAGALEAFEQARARQDPKIAEGDRELVEFYVKTGREQDSVESMRRVVRASPDASTHSYIKRMIETLIRLGKYDEAESELGALAATAATDSGYLLLQADIRSGKGDSRGARQSLDEAASRFNDEPMVFMRRAQWLMNQPDMLRDARADADKAVKLGPTLWQALRLRSMISYQLDMKDEAIGDLRAALRIAPSLDELREMLVDNLLRMDRVDEAVSVCDENIALRKDDQAVSASCGAIFARAGDWGRSARYYQKAFDTEKSVRNAGWLAGAMLNQTPPDIANAQKTLLVVQDKIASDGNLSMLRARLFKAQDKRTEAKQAAAEALKLMDPTSGAQMLRWYGDVQNIVADAKEMLPYLQGIEQAGTAKDWMVFFRGNVMFNDPAQREQGSELMKTLTTSLDKPAALRLNAFRALTIAYYREKRWEDARAIMMKGLEQFPDDFELNNNLAFTLAKHLKRPAEALPYAEKIANSKQRAPEALDTLGYVYFLNNKLDEAQKALMAAIPMPQSAQSAAVAMIHLAEVSLAKGDKAEAKRLIEGVDKLLALPASGNALDPASKQELEDMRKRAE